jgi:hypothetical protein
VLLSNKSRAGGNIDFKLYYRGIVANLAWYWHKNSHVDQCNRIEDPKIKPHNDSHLIFDKTAKNIYWIKESFSTNCSRKTGYLNGED